MKLRETIKEHWPTKEQYRLWSLPSKLTFLGLCVGSVTLLSTPCTIAIPVYLNAQIHRALIPKEWNDEQARRIAIDMIREYDGFGILENSGEIASTLEHDILGTFYLKYAQCEAVLIVGSSRIPGRHGDCHACGRHISVIEFVKQENGWDIERVYLDAFTGGQWGFAPAIKAITVGYDLFGLIIEAGGTNMGIATVFTYIYAPVADELALVFREKTEHYGGEHEPILDDSGNLEAYSYRANWSSRIWFRQAGTSFYDLHLHREGDMEEEMHDAIFKFDGQVYSTSELYGENQVTFPQKPWPAPN